MFGPTTLVALADTTYWHVNHPAVQLAGRYYTVQDPQLCSRLLPGCTIILGVLQTRNHLQISKITVDLHVLLIVSAQIKFSRYSSILLY